MKAIVYDLATGKIFLEIEGAAAQVAAQAVEGHSGVIEGEGATATHHVEDGRILPRPVLHLPASAEVQAGVPWFVDDLPIGSLVAVDGEDVGAIDEAGLGMRFDVAGNYVVEIRPPFPWLPATCAMSVVP